MWRPDDDVEYVGDEDALVDEKWLGPYLKPVNISKVFIFRCGWSDW